MTQKRVRRRSQSSLQSSVTQPEQSDYSPARQPISQKRPSNTSQRERRKPAWSDQDSRDSQPSQTWLTSLIEQDAPLKSNTTLVLMYGPFQAELGAEDHQGVASWLRDCLRKHGIPSLVRFDHRHRAQVYRRDQFQPWLEPVLSQLPDREAV
jgi:hypothetical protein